jgi:hypothetical protein
VPAKQRLPSARSTPTVACNVNSAQTVRAESEQRQKAHQIVNSDCPVAQAIRAPTVETVRTLTVGWRGWCTGQCLVAHQTVWCAHRQQPFPNGCFGGWGYKYPQPPLFKASKFPAYCIKYKSSRLHSKTQTRDQILSKVQNHSKHLVTCEREIFVFIWVLVAWIAFFFPILVLQDTCNQSKRHQVVVVLVRGLSDPFD